MLYEYADKHRAVIFGSFLRFKVNISLRASAVLPLHPVSTGLSVVPWSVTLYNPLLGIVPWFTVECNRKHE